MNFVCLIFSTVTAFLYLSNVSDPLVKWIVALITPLLALIIHLLYSSCFKIEEDLKQQNFKTLCYKSEFFDLVFELVC